jgi:transcriptional regulator with GAF, ATPase, and Fis domain
VDGPRSRLLYDLGCAFTARLDLEELAPLIVEKCREALDAEGAAVLLLDDERGELYFPYVADEDPEVADSVAEVRFPASAGIAGAVLRDGTPTLVNDVAADPRFYAGVDRQTGLSTRSLLAVPLRGRMGAIGVVQVVNSRAPEGFAPGDLDLLVALSGSVAIAIENARLWAAMKKSTERLTAEVGVLRRDIAQRERFGRMVGTAPAMTAVLRLMESAAASTITVLLEGETGTGKELVARGIHAASARATQPFVAVNCAALPETLLESELFGHRRGAFTGATQDQRGLFEAASGGTILLDEIGEMPLGMQAKLLRVLQDGEVTPVGERTPRKVDVRVISATNRDLLGAVSGRTFRDDLYYRVGAFPIRLPPLRDRPEDVPALVKHFLVAAAERARKRVVGIAPAALDRLVAYGWPGNVRELQNEIERAVVLAPDGAPIDVEHLSTKVMGVAPSPAATAAEAEPGASRDLRDARTEFEVQFIRKVLSENAGNVSRAARALGISRVALQKKMKEYGLR